VVAGLQQAYARLLLPRDAIENVVHQTQPEAAVLYGRIDADRSDAGNGRSLVEEIAADDFPLVLGDHRVEARMDQRPQQALARHLRRGKVRREVMDGGDRLEGFIADSAARRGVGGRARTKNDAHRLLSPIRDAIVSTSAIDSRKESAPWLRGGFCLQQH
jgi:hypothetical protein